MPIMSTIEIASSLDELSVVAQKVCSFCDALGVDDTVRYDVELCAVEAASNVIIHGYEQEPGRPIWLTLIADASRLTVVIEDEGRPHDFNTLHPRPLDEIDALSESGRGVSIIQAVAQSVAYGSECHRNRLSMCFPMEPRKDEVEG
jgi:serine/threonine-protein kinase RsbW